MKEYEINELLFDNLNVKNEYAHISILVEVSENEESSSRIEYKKAAFQWYLALQKKFKNAKIYLYQDIVSNDSQLYEQVYQFDEMELNCWSESEFIENTYNINKILKSNDVMETTITQLMYENSAIIVFCKNSPRNYFTKIIDNYNCKIGIVENYSLKKDKGFKPKKNYIEKINSKIESILKRNKTIRLEFECTKRIPKLDINDTKFQNQQEFNLEFKYKEFLNYNRITNGRKIINLDESRTEIEIKNANGFVPFQIDDEIVLLRIKNNKIEQVESCGIYSKKLRDQLRGKSIDRFALGIGHFFNIEPINDPYFDMNIFCSLKLNQEIEFNSTKNYLIFNYSKVKLNQFIGKTKIIKNNKLN